MGTMIFRMTNLSEHSRNRPPKALRRGYSVRVQTSQRAASGRSRLSPSGIVLLVGVVLLLVAAPTLFVVAATTEARWALPAGLACAISGLVTVGQVLMPQRASFRGGTKIWQNDGLPGGGGL
jgi:hypothetical protein